jgi:hypothetical protein
MMKPLGGCVFGKKDALGKMVLSRFFVTCKDSIPSFYGVLVRSDRAVLVFADVKVVNPGSPSLDAAEGELYIDRVHVAYLQKVPSAAQ